MALHKVPPRKVLGVCGGYLNTDPGTRGKEEKKTRRSLCGSEHERDQDTLYLYT